MNVYEIVDYATFEVERFTLEEILDILIDGIDHCKYKAAVVHTCCPISWFENNIEDYQL